MMTLKVLGIMWRSTIFKGETPISRAAITYSERLIWSIWERTSRAMGHQPVTVMAKSKVGMLLLSSTTDIMMTTSRLGTELRISTIRIISISTLPPK